MDDSIRSDLLNKQTKINYAIVFLLMIAIFIVFSIYRQTCVGACDWYSYYQHAQLLKSGKLYLDTQLNPVEYPAVAPIGFYTRNGKVIPHFPPGYPALMALFGLANLETFVTPLMGALSFLLLYLIMIRLTDRGIALIMAFLWALSPLVCWGSTRIMSDMVATTFILLTFYMLQEEKIHWAGLVFGFALMIRPSNFLFVAVLLPILIKQRKLIRFMLYTAIFGSVFGGYNWVVHGLPWKYGFYNYSKIFSSSQVPTNSLFYGKELFLQYTPLLLLPAIWALWKKWRETYVYAIWFFVFLFFHCFVQLGTRNWWGLRFLLPSLPVIFILSGIGLKDITMRIKGKWNLKTSHLKIAGTVFTILMAAYFCYYISGVYLFKEDEGKFYYDYSLSIAEKVPPNSIIGCCNFSGSLRLYTGLETFNILDSNSLKIIRHNLQIRPVYIITEPSLKETWFFSTYSKRYQYADPIEVVPGSPFKLKRIIKRKIRAWHEAEKKET